MPMHAQLLGQEIGKSSHLSINDFCMAVTSLCISPLCCNTDIVPDGLGIYPRDLEAMPLMRCLVFITAKHNLLATHFPNRPAHNLCIPHLRSHSLTTSSDGV